MIDQLVDKIGDTITNVFKLSIHINKYYLFIRQHQFLSRAGMVIFWTERMQLLCSQTPANSDSNSTSYEVQCDKEAPYIFVYYIISEVIPSLLLLYILRELPK